MNIVLVNNEIKVLTKAKEYDTISMYKHIQLKAGSGYEYRIYRLGVDGDYLASILHFGTRIIISDKNHILTDIKEVSPNYIVELIESMITWSLRYRKQLYPASVLREMCEYCKDLMYIVGQRIHGKLIEDYSIDDFISEYSQLEQIV